MTHMDAHKVNGYCLCLCEECVTLSVPSEDSICHCPLGCACHRPRKPLPAAYYPVVTDKPKHVCKDCGVEVFRKGTRGRYPSRCIECHT